MKDLSRRDLIKLGLAGAGSMFAGGLGLPKSLLAGVPKTQKASKVINNKMHKRALTLLERAKLLEGLGGEQNLLTAEVMEYYARSSEILEHIPFHDICGNSVCFTREVFGRKNEGVAVSLERNTITIEVNPDKDKREYWGNIKGLGLAKANDFVKEFKEICHDPHVLSNGYTALSLENLEKLTNAVEDPTHLLMNRTMRRRLVAAARLGTVRVYLTADVDAFGRRVVFYNDIPIIAVHKYNNYNEILPFDKDKFTTSIYCLSLTPKGVVGLQNNNMKVRDLGDSIEIDWKVGTTYLRDHSIARLAHITDGLITK